MKESFTKNNDDWDCRALASNFLEKFSPNNGTLYPYVELVKKHSELEFCLRGNKYSKNPTSEGKVCIYRNNHVMFTIMSKKICIELAYFEKYEDKENILNKLEKNYGFSKNRKCLSADNTGKVIDKLDFLYEEMTKIFDAFFDYKSNKEIEKIRQQQIYHFFKKQKNGFLIYDMEFSQKHKSKAETDKDKDINKPDMQAIRFDENGNPISWVLIEVKCTKAAYDGKSGLANHIKKMRKYLENRERIKARKREAYMILYQYNKLGLIELQKEIFFEQYDNLKEEIVLIFTDDAIQLWEKDLKNKDNKTNSNLEEITIINGEKLKVLLVENV